MKQVLFLACALPLAAQQGVNFYSVEKEIALGNQLAAEFQRNTTVTSDARIDKLGAALVPKTSPFQYHFRTFDGGGHEAVTFPGGWVFVPQSLLARDDRQLSAILAHAIGHIELRHGTRLATNRELAEIGTQVAAVTMPPGQSSLMVPAGMLKFQRSFELAADLQAIQLLRNAGLDPASLVDYLRTLPPVEKPMLSDHPMPQTRIDAAEKAITAQ
jgi:predicted Zn-dependent protease